MSNQTFYIQSGAQSGDAVVLLADGSYGRGADTNQFGGVVVKREQDGYGAVLTGGDAVVTYTGALTSGIQQLAVDGAGKVKTSAAGPHFHVTIVNATTKKARVRLPW